MTPSKASQGVKVESYAEKFDDSATIAPRPPKWMTAALITGKNAMAGSKPKKGNKNGKRRRRAAPERLAVVSPAVVAAKLGIKPYFADALVSDRGLSFKVYHDMLTDPMVQSGLRNLKLPVILRPWTVTPYADDGKQPTQRAKEIAAFAEHTLRGNVGGRFVRDLYAIASGVEFGFSVSEMVMERISAGRFAGKIGLRCLKGKDPDEGELDFDVDEFGNIRGVLHTFEGVQTNHGRDGFVIFQNLNNFENPFGRSDLRAAYKFWWMKDTALKLRAVYLERFAGGQPVMKYPDEMDPDEFGLREILESWMAETGVLLPEGVTLDLLEVSSSHNDVFHSSIEDFDRQILQAILGAVLQSLEGQKTGALRMGEVHQQTASNFAEVLAVILAETVQAQMVETLVDLNFDARGMYPRFGFKKRPEDLEKVVNVFATASEKLGLEIPAQQVYDDLGIRQPLPGEELIKGPQVSGVVDRLNPGDKVGGGRPTPTHQDDANNEPNESAIAGNGSPPDDRDEADRQLERERRDNRDAAFAQYAEFAEDDDARRDLAELIAAESIALHSVVPDLKAQSAAIFDAAKKKTLSER